MTDQLNTSTYMALSEPIAISEQQWDDGMLQFVSISCLTYNHGPYIREALEGFLIQKTTFPVKIFIFEDCSTDDTVSIIKEYQAKYPHLFVPFFQPENTWGKPMRKKALAPFFNARKQAKYLAICEGDDYWTDSLKLQKQIDFLEANEDYSFCFHDALVIHENSGKQHLRVGSRKIDPIVDLKSVIIQNNFATASLVFRSAFYNATSDILSKTAKGDYAVVILLAEKGLGRYLPEVMSAYRLHEGGVWSSKSSDYKLEQDVEFYDLWYNYFDDASIKKVIVQKRNKTKQSQSLNAMRSGEFIKGLLGWLAHFNFTTDPRLSSSPRKVLSAMKEGFGKL